MPGTYQLSDLALDTEHIPPVLCARHTCKYTEYILRRHSQKWGIKSACNSVDLEFLCQPTNMPCHTVYTYILVHTMMTTPVSNINPPVFAFASLWITFHSQPVWNYPPDVERPKHTAHIATEHHGCRQVAVGAAISCGTTWNNTHTHLLFNHF